MKNRFRKKVLVVTGLCVGLSVLFSSSVNSDAHLGRKVDIATDNFSFDLALWKAQGKFISLEKAEEIKTEEKSKDTAKVVDGSDTSSLSDEANKQNQKYDNPSNPDSGQTNLPDIVTDGDQNAPADNITTNTPVDNTTNDQKSAAAPGIIAKPQTLNNDMGDLVYYNTDGNVLSGFWLVDDVLYYFNKMGIETSGLIKEDDAVYYLSNHTLTKNNWLSVQDDTYYFNANGVAVSGVSLVNNIYYCFNESSLLVKNGFKTIAGQTYYADSEGKAQIGWYTSAEGTYYFSSNGNMLLGFQNIEGATYCFAGDGKMLKGFQNIDNKIYYFLDSGKMALGLQTINNDTYYFGSNGIRYSGAVSISGTFYCFDQEGKKVSGFQTTDGYTYHYDSSGNMTTGFYSVAGLKLFFNSHGQLLSTTAKKIIDVSYAQGSINWDTVNSSGDIDGAILRCGFGSEGGDSQFVRNVANCNRLGIPYGAYLYSYAENTYEANLEALNCINKLQAAGASLSYPVYYDLEANKYTSHLTKAEYTAIAQTFISTMEAAGYTVRIYSYTSLLMEKLTDSSLLPYIDWVAQYNWRCNYDLTTYSGWQFTSSGVIPGINGKVDISLWYH